MKVLLEDIISWIISTLPYAYPNRVAWKLRFLFEDFLWQRIHQVGLSGLFMNLIVDGYGVRKQITEVGKYLGDSDNLEKVIKIAQERFQIEISKTLEVADNACQNIFTIGKISGKVVNCEYGKDIDWEFPPTILDVSVDNLRRMLNRQEFLISLAQAALLTGEDRYADCVSRLLDDWIKSHPIGIGPSWREFLEVSKRSCVWLMVHSLLGNYQSMASIKPILIEQLSINAGYLYRHLSFHSPNNHLITETKTLAILGMLLAGHPRADAWWRRGSDIFFQQILKQTHPDGVNAEQSMGYHLIVCRDVLEFMILAQQYGKIVPPDFTEAALSMVEFIDACRKPKDGLPVYGDSETINTDEDVDLILHLARHIFHEYSFQESTCSNTYRGLWYLPHQPISIGFERSTAEDMRLVRTFPFGGHTIMKSADRYLAFKHSLFGLDIPKVHGHADALSIELSNNERDLLIDPGSYGYVDDEYRNYFRSTRAHNTVVVDGMNQTPLFGAMLTGRRTTAKAKKVLHNDHFSFVLASHNGYERLKQPITHSRAILFTQSNIWIILDTFKGIGSHTFDQFWHFHHEIFPTIDDNLVCSVSSNNDPVLRIVPLLTSDINASIGKGETTPLLGWSSVGWLKAIPSPFIKYSKEVDVEESEFATLLLLGSERFILRREKNSLQAIIKHDDGIELFLWRSDTLKDGDLSKWWHTHTGSHLPFVYRGNILFGRMENDGSLNWILMQQGKKFSFLDSSCDCYYIY
jgi:hypothetical protein